MQSQNNFSENVKLLTRQPPSGNCNTGRRVGELEGNVAHSGNVKLLTRQPPRGNGNTGRRVGELEGNVAQPQSQNIFRPENCRPN